MRQFEWLLKFLLGMIRFLLIINNHGKARLTKFYSFYSEEQQQKLVRECYALVTRRGEEMCNFLEASFPFLENDLRIIYRHYATLYFVCGVDAVESELGILDLIQVFVETLDRCFENVCELDIIFHPDKVHYVLDEIIVGGLVMETNVTEIYNAVQLANNQEARLLHGNCQN
ncbi:AP-3 complex subunit sigma-1 [Galdieria sulphuraria]|nr:AP-3 complex subunit sigma-1 [Galdieria sulphuraria]